jgi:hypothetical protein
MDFRYDDLHRAPVGASQIVVRDCRGLPTHLHGRFGSVVGEGDRVRFTPHHAAGAGVQPFGAVLPDFVSGVSPVSGAAICVSAITSGGLL